jgi:hypothetical protein
MRYEFWIKPNEIALKRQFASAGNAARAAMLLH